MAMSRERPSILKFSRILFRFFQPFCSSSHSSNSCQTRKLLHAYASSAKAVGFETARESFSFWLTDSLRFLQRFALGHQTQNDNAASQRYPTCCQSFPTESLPCPNDFDCQPLGLVLLHHFLIQDDFQCNTPYYRFRNALQIYLRR